MVMMLTSFFVRANLIVSPDLDLTEFAFVLHKFLSAIYQPLREQILIINNWKGFYVIASNLSSFM